MHRYKELDSVVLAKPVFMDVVFVPAGSRGVIMHVYTDGLGYGYEVEFHTPTHAVLSVEDEDLKDG